jgi:uncharacterized protein (TIGR00369 family)
MTGGFDLSYGLELVEVRAGRAQGRVVVREEHKQPFGAVHAGVYAAIAERLTSLATARAVAPDRGIGALAVLSSQTSYVRPITEGTIHALAVAKHQGRTTWVWEVEFSDDQSRLCVLARVTIAVSEASAR